MSTLRAHAIVIAAPSLDLPDAAVRRSLDELAHLLAGLGLPVVAEVVQRRGPRASPSYLGDGKLREVAARTGGPGEVPRGPHTPPPARADLVVVADDELTPGQHRQLEGALGVEVLDRTAVILRVFEARASTRVARLEVELARVQHELPRVRDDHALGDREGGGGRASRGHSNVELAKQRLRARAAALRRELATAAEVEAARRDARPGQFRVALVGYTNAGKSAIMRQLTGHDVLVADRLFATLGTTVRPVAPPATPPVLVVDTVGFLHRLPHALIASFRSTLGEARDASLLLHVIDAADPASTVQAEVTETVLGDIGARAPVLRVLNKADRLSPEARAGLTAAHPDAVLHSALVPGDGAALRARIDAFFARFLVEASVTIPYARQDALAAARDRLTVVHAEYGEAIEAVVRGTPEAVAALRARLR